jgi:hypothetical protein
VEAQLHALLGWAAKKAGAVSESQEHTAKAAAMCPSVLRTLQLEDPSTKSTVNRHLPTTELTEQQLNKLLGRTTQL